MFIKLLDDSKVIQRSFEALIGCPKFLTYQLSKYRGFEIFKYAFVWRRCTLNIEADHSQYGLLVWNVLPTGYLPELVRLLQECTFWRKTQNQELFWWGKEWRNPNNLRWNINFIIKYFLNALDDHRLYALILESDQPLKLAHVAPLLRKASGVKLFSSPSASITWPNSNLYVL